MKKINLVLIPIFFCNFLFSEDILVLKNDMIFKGEIIKIKKNKIIFSAEHKEYMIPNRDVFGVYFEDEDNPIYLHLLKYKDGDEYYDSLKCIKGRMDAKSFHGKGFGNFALGFFFGVFGLVGCIVSNPGIENGSKTKIMSQNKELFNDSEYLECYKEKAKNKSVVNAGIGWATGAIVLFTILAIAFPPP
jgi:hypothetical protein